MQRGWVTTLAISLNSARERSALSPMPENEASGRRSRGFRVVVFCTCASAAPATAARQAAPIAPNKTDRMSSPPCAVENARTALRFACNAGQLFWTLRAAAQAAIPENESSDSRCGPHPPFARLIGLSGAPLAVLTFESRSFIA
jgi:hypothetical protein